MLFKDEEKEKIIKELNQNFRTILSYGNKGLIPAGEFIVKDIQQPKLPNGYASKADAIKFTNIILTKIDDEKTEIVLPMTTFLTKFSDLAIKNAYQFSISTDPSLSIQNVEKNAEIKVISDETLKHLTDANTIPLEECDADYLINGEPQASNYSICPVDLGAYRERIRDGKYEKVYKINDSKRVNKIAKEEENDSKRINKIAKEEENDFKRINNKIAKKEETKDMDDYER